MMEELKEAIREYLINKYYLIKSYFIGRIPRKWEYIADWCKQNNETELEKIAQQIDSVLYDLYGNKHTPMWRAVYTMIRDKTKDTDVNPILIYNLAASPSTCTACIVHSFDCEECYFGMKCGICKQSNSKFVEFMRLFSKEYFGR